MDNRADMMMRKLEREARAREQAEKYLEDISQTLYEQAREKDKLLHALQESQERYTALVDNIPEAILIEVNGQIEFANRAACDLLGITNTQLPPLSSLHYVAPDFRQHAQLQMTQVLLDLAHVSCEELVVGLNGQLIDVETDRIGFMYQNQPAIQVVMRQIGERKILAQERLNHSLAVQRNQTLQALSEHKSNFIANISHEIRTPMNGVTSMVDLLSKTQLNDEQSEYVELLQFSSRALLHIINQVLDLSQLEAGKLSIEPIVFTPARLVSSCVKLFAAYAAHKNIELSFDIHPNVPAFLRGDPARLGQVLLNLISNALKFTQTGSVKVRLDAFDVRENNAQLIFEVKDTGAGIATEKLPLLFKRYEQVGGKTSERFGGTGLGLQICKELMNAMGGDIHVSSSLNQGTTVVCELVLEVSSDGVLADDWMMQWDASLLDDDFVSSRHAEQKQTVVQGVRRILLVEDNSINQLIVQKSLSPERFELVCANDGLLGLEAWQNNSFDLILMDIWMPNMDGLQTTQLIRQKEAEQGLPRIPIVALTANTLEADKNNALAAGMDDYLQKPIRLNDLERVLKDWLG